MTRLRDGLSKTQDEIGRNKVLTSKPCQTVRLVLARRRSSLAIFFGFSSGFLPCPEGLFQIRAECPRKNGIVYQLFAIGQARFTIRSGFVAKFGESVASWA